MRRVLSSTRRHCPIRAGIFLLIAALIAGIAGCDGNPSQNLEIRDWYDLDAVRDNPAANYTLMNDLDSTTAGYAQLASETAHGGKGWDPILVFIPNSGFRGLTGTFNGHGHEIRDLFINRPSEDYAGLFGYVNGGGAIQDVGVVNVTIVGAEYVGGLAGYSHGIITNSYSTGSVTGSQRVGGLVGMNPGTVSGSYSTCSMTGDEYVGGLVGLSLLLPSTLPARGVVSNCYSTSSVTGNRWVGGLVGGNMNTNGTVEDSHSDSSVAGREMVGGLVGGNSGTTSNSYCTGSVTGSQRVGGLVGQNSDRVNDCYSAGSVAGESQVGGLVGYNGYATISDSYSTGDVSGASSVGGLIGCNYYATVTNSYSMGNVTGQDHTGGLVGEDQTGGIVGSSFWDIQTSGQAVSDGGTAKNTTEMHDIATFSGAGWDIITVALNEINLSYIWNIVNSMTYPFLSWQAI
jgi:The GLUG motif